jgi:hypothetical protein
MRGLVILALAAGCGLASCAGAPGGVPRIEVQTVPLPTPTPCAVDPGAPPAFPDTDAAIQAAPDIYGRAKLYAAGRLLRAAWEARLTAALKGCEGQGPSP